jgi:hypothetical protein
MKEIDFSWTSVKAPRQDAVKKRLTTNLEWTLMHVGVPAAALGALLLIAFVLASLASFSLGTTTPPPKEQGLLGSLGAYWYAIFAAVGAAAVVVGNLLLKKSMARPAAVTTAAETN